MSKRYYETAVHVEQFDPSRYRWVVKGLHREAAIRQLDRSGVFPGTPFQLRAPRAEDPETGGPLDVDGDRSMDRFDLYGGELFVQPESVTVTGYQPLETEDGYFTGKLVLVRWVQVPYRWIVKQDAEHAENIALGERLSEREREVLIALREEAIRLDNEKPYQHTMVVVPSDGEEVQIGETTVGLEEIKGLATREDSLLLHWISDRAKNYRTQPPREMTEVYLYHTGEEIADHFRGKNA